MTRWLVLCLWVGCGSSGGGTAPPEPTPPAPSPEAPPGSSTPEAHGSASEHSAVDEPSEPAPELARPASDEVEMDALRAYAEGSAALGFDLYQQVARGGGNLALSPASISLAFSMTWAGARGATAAEMQRVLHLGDDAAEVHAGARSLLNASRTPGGDTTLRVVNRLFGEQTYTFEQDFLALVRDEYGAPLERVTFVEDAEAQRSRINQWVAEQTQDRIEELLPGGALDERTRLVLVNAIYFLAKWQHEFDASATSDRPFFVDGGAASQPVPTMRQAQTLPYGEAEGVELLELPYRGGELSMLVVLPKERDGLASVERRLSPELLTGWLDALAPQRVAVSLPKWTIEGSRVPLTSVLPELGMRLAFSRADADFSGMAQPPNPADELYISSAFHEAFVKVDEAGTEAAAATAVVMALRGAPPRPPAVTFDADHPFLFLIRHRPSGTLLFLGRVTDPR